MIWLAVGAGGALGSMARHGVNIFFGHILERAAPYATGAVNLVGSAVIGLLVPLFRSNSAAVRFWLWFAASMKFLVPFALLAALGSYFLPILAANVAAPVLTAIRPTAAHLTFAAPLVAPAPAHIPAADVAVIIWAMGLIAIALLCLSRWLDLRLSLREARPVAANAPVPVKSAVISSPSM